MTLVLSRAQPCRSTAVSICTDCPVKWGRKGVDSTMSDADDTNSPTTNGADGWADALTSMGETWQKTMEDWSTMWAKNMHLTLKAATEKSAAPTQRTMTK